VPFLLPSVAIHRELGGGGSIQNEYYLIHFTHYCIGGLLAENNMHPSGM